MLFRRDGIKVPAFSVVGFSNELFIRLLTGSDE